MELPKRLTQDQASMVVTMVLLEEFGTDETVAEYINDAIAYGQEHRVPVWPSVWDQRAEDALKDDFEEWCFETAWLASL